MTEKVKIYSVSENIYEGVKPGAWMHVVSLEDYYTLQIENESLKAQLLKLQSPMTPVEQTVGSAPVKYSDSRASIVTKHYHIIEN